MNFSSCLWVSLSALSLIMRSVIKIKFTKDFLFYF